MSVPWLVSWLFVGVPLLFHEGPGLPLVAVGVVGGVAPWIWRRIRHSEVAPRRPYPAETTGTTVDLEPRRWWPDLVATTLFVLGVAVDVWVLTSDRMNAATAAALTAAIVPSAALVIVRGLLRVIFRVTRA